MRAKVHILSVGYERTLMASRSMVLRSAGYEVEEAHSLAQALSRVDADVVDLVIICHTLSEREQQELIAAARRKRRLLPLLCITTLESACPVTGCSTVTNSPLELLQGVRAACHPLSGARD